jgi:hypothetical protein
MMAGKTALQWLQTRHHSSLGPNATQAESLVRVYACFCATCTSTDDPPLHGTRTGWGIFAPVGFRKWQITAIVLIAGKYFLGDSATISQTIARHELTATRQIRNAYAKSHAKKEFFVFRIARESDIYIGRSCVL